MSQRERDPATAPTVAKGTPTWNEASAPTSATLPVDDPDRYSLVGEHARGGLGRVVRAVDTRLGRTVAVKELLKKSDTAEALFVREALITARLQHPSIVPVIEAGRWPSGEPYYVMKLVEGRSLKELIADRKALAQRLALLPHVIAVAEAIGYAHSRDVIHRDVKPANVVVGEFGETVVVDWGLARDGRAADAAAEDARLTAGLIPPSGSGSVETVSGRVIGTPQYMSPEQARGEVVDARSDVYSLGALLFEVLAGVAPYTGGDADTILQKVIDGPPPPLATMQAGVPTDLLAIVAKAMERDPGMRYPTGKELAQDLQRFATGQLVTAQQYSSMELLRRWMRRNRGVVAAMVVSTVILLLVATGMIRRIVEERDIARREGKRAQLARTIAEKQSKHLIMLQAESSVRRDPTATVAWLKKYPIDVDSSDEIATLLDEAIASNVAQHVLRQDDWVYDVAFTPDSRLMSTASKDGLVRVYDTTTGAMRILGEHKPEGVTSVLFAEEGKALITGGADGQIQLWPTAGGQPRVIGQLDGPAMKLELNARGELRVWTENEDFGAWQMPAGVPIVRLRNDPSLTGVSSGAGSPLEVSRWVVGYPDGRVVQLSAGAPDGTEWMLPRPARVISFSNDARRVAIYDGAELHMIDLETRARTVIGKLSAPAHYIHWSPDDAQLGIHGDMHALYVFKTAAPNEPRVLTGHTDAIYNVQFTRDGKRVLTASDDGTARVWDLLTGNAEVLRGHEDDVYKARFSPDETMVATASLDRTARLWRLGQGGGVMLGGDVDAIYGVHMLDDGDAVTVSMPFQVRRWNLATGASTTLVPRTDSVFKAMRPAVSKAGDLAYAVVQSGEIDIVRADGSKLHLTGHTNRLTGGGFSADGKLLISAGHDGTVRKWDLATATSEVISRGNPVLEATMPPAADHVFVVRDGEIEMMDLDGHVRAKIATKDVGFVVWQTKIMFSPDGANVVFAGKGHIYLWTPSTGRTIPLEWTGHHCTNVSFSPDGKTLAGAMADRTVQLWNVEDGRRLGTMYGHTDLVMSAAFSPDGALLATTSYDRTVRVWNLAEGTSRVLRGHTASVEVVKWIDGGQRLLTASRDGTLRIWPVPPTATPVADELRHRIEAATTAIVGPEERLATPVAP